VKSAIRKSFSALKNIGHWWDRRGSHRTILCVFVVYGLIHALISILDGNALAHDDVKINILTQSFSLGYLPDNPPLYEWVLLLVQQVTGPRLISFLMVKYTLFAVTGLLFYDVMVRLTDQKVWGSVTAFALVMFVQTGWNYHQAFTHSLVLIAAIAFFLWSVVRLWQCQSMLNYCLLGVALGFGLISKYSFPASVFVVFVSLAFTKYGRGVIINPKILISFFIALVIFLPHGIWLFEHHQGFAERFHSKFVDDDASSGFEQFFGGLTTGSWAIISFYLPLIIFLTAGGLLYGVLTRTAILPITIAREIGQNFHRPSGVLARHKWLLYTLPVGALLLMVLVIVTGTKDVQERYAIAFMLPSYLLIMIALSWSRDLMRRASIMQVVFVLTAFVIGVVRLVQVGVAGAPFCTHCRQWVPFDGLVSSYEFANELTTTLVGYDEQTAGNLRRYFPKARVISSWVPAYVPPGGDEIETCYFIWSPDLEELPPRKLLNSFSPSTITDIEVNWKHPLKKSNWRTVMWHVTSIGEDSNHYKEYCGVANT